MTVPPGWELKKGKLFREFTFESFAEAIRFVNRIAVIAERLNHHPEIWNSYTTLRLVLSTHDAGGIATEKDTGLAREINTLC